jgi:hypothetical protein
MATSPQTIRLVTHLDVSAAMIAATIKIILAFQV